MPKLVIYTDGACRGNPGPGGAAFAVLNEDGSLLCTASRPVGKCTSNQAEYFALEYALDFCLEHGHMDVEFRNDSEVMVKQLNGEYVVKSPGLKDRHAAVQGTLGFLRGGKNITFVHVPREENKIADALAKDASHGKDTGLVWED